jgi:hypothetical protein
MLDSLEHRLGEEKIIVKLNEINFQNQQSCFLRKFFTLSVSRPNVFETVSRSYYEKASAYSRLIAIFLLNVLNASSCFCGKY